MKKIEVKSYARRKNRMQLKKAMSFNEMLPVYVKSHLRLIPEK